MARENAVGAGGEEPAVEAGVGVQHSSFRV